MPSGSQFGGPWTEKKLVVLEKYLHAWRQILKHRPRYRTLYIDAFAGSGTLERAIEETSGDAFLPAFELKEEVAFETEFALGSAHRALRVVPPFDQYIFIEMDPAKAALLNELKDEYPEHTIEVLQTDANAAVQSLCERGEAFWRRHRAVLFLDPFGMQVEWKTIQAVARTQAIDVWILFPLGQAVNRLLTRDGKIPEAWKVRLDRLFGTNDWQKAFYGRSGQGDLFEVEPRLEKSANLKQIADFYRMQLGKIFAGASPNPAALRNSRGNPIFMLYFAVSNPYAVRPALKIASDLLNGIREDR